MKNPTDWDTRNIAPVNLFSTSIKVSKIKKIRLVNSQFYFYFSIHMINKKYIEYYVSH